jgi:hypothetical protein
MGMTAGWISWLTHSWREKRRVSKYVSYVVPVLNEAPLNEDVFITQLSVTPWRCDWGVTVQLHTFLILALNGGEWSASWPGRFTPPPRGESARYPLDRTQGRPQSRSGRGAKEKIKPAPAGNRVPVVQLVASHCTNWATLLKMFEEYTLQKVTR